MWREDEDGLKYGVDFSLTHKLSKSHALIYELNNAFETHPKDRLDETNLRMRYRRQVWRKWMFIEGAPQIALRNDDEFEPTPGILFALEIILGGNQHLAKTNNSR